MLASWLASNIKLWWWIMFYMVRNVQLWSNHVQLKRVGYVMFVYSDTASTAFMSFFFSDTLSCSNCILGKRKRLYQISELYQYCRSKSCKVGVPV